MNFEAFHQIEEQCRRYDASLIAVSKTRTVEEILSLYQEGQRAFGENRIEEINRKAPNLPQDIQWHLIGPLQSKKVKLYHPSIHLFHALDRIKIWDLLNDCASENNIRVKVLLQVHIAQEESKHGFKLEELVSVIQSQDRKHQTKHQIDLIGVMGMATNTTDVNVIKNEFTSLKAAFDRIQKECPVSRQFTEISMGMSGDYPIALECGATLIRVGSKIFGPRQY